MRLTTCLVILIAACLPPSATSLARDRALVIGVNKYPNLVNGKSPKKKYDLRGPVADAETFVGLLVDILAFNRSDVKQLTDAEATRQNILDQIQTWLIDGSNPGDRVVLYFAGHGATAEVENPDGTKHLTSTLVPSDAASDLGESNLQVTGMIEGRTIGQLLERMPGRQVMVVADSCHSGSVTRGLPNEGDDRLIRTITPRLPVGMPEARYTRAIQTRLKTSGELLDRGLIRHHVGSLAVWQAATLAQVTFDLRDRPGGIFTQSLADGLRDRKAARRGGEVTAGRLINYVRERAKEFCEATPKCTAGLTPTLDAEPAYRDLVLNPYHPAGLQDSAGSGQEASTDAQNLFTHKNDFQLHAEVLPGTRVKLGQQVQFRVTSAEVGTLAVLDAGPDGKLRQIFPNKFSEMNNKGAQVNARATITIPDATYGFAFTATDSGSGTLLVLVAEKSLDLSSVINRHLNFDAIKKPRDLVVELADQIGKPLLTPDLDKPNRAYRWAFVAVPYVIEP